MRSENSRDVRETLYAARAAAVNGNDLVSPAQGETPFRKNRFCSGDVLSNRFLIIRFLGSGGMGEVYEAKDTFLQDGAIALKTISPELASSPDAQARFKQEVILARQVTHPNVCPIYEIHYHRDGGGLCCFLSMKLLQGETLAERLDRDRSLPAQEAVLVIHQVADALHAAHRAGIVHRDIKPSNIMLTGVGPAIRAVVMDFGLAREFNSARSAGSTVLIGTPAYMAPELIKGHAATAASDLYAFGLVMHEIFGGEQPQGYKADIKLTPALRAAGVPASLPPLVMGCLDDDPNKRLTAFRHYLGKAVVDTGIANSTYQARPFWTRRRWLLATGSAGCLLGAGTVLEFDDLFALLHPLPRKRFVALVNWPPTLDAQLSPMLSGVIDALERELARAEAFDHDLFVIPPGEIDSGAAPLQKVLGSVGANLMLASSATSHENGIRLSLQVRDPSASTLFRKRTIRCGFEEAALLPQMAVRTAAELLEVSKYVKSSNRLKPGTQSPEAYRAFQQAEALRRKPNDAGLEDAIEKYKEAIDQDIRFAQAHAALAMAYGRKYILQRDPAALDLAQANASTALDLDPNSVDGHLALGWDFEHRGQTGEAVSEMNKALALDPANPTTLIWQARLYSRMDDFMRAEELFRRVLKARPNLWLGYNELGEVLNRQGKYAEALQAYRSASLAQPGNALPLNNVGEVSLILGDLRQARESLEKSIELSPSGEAAANLAQELRAEGLYKDALKMALKAVSLDASDHESWRELGDCYSALGRKQDARKAFVAAADAARRVLSINRSDGPTLILLALYDARLGQTDAARIDMKKADALGMADLDSQLVKARTLEILGQRDEAIKILAACFKRGATKFQISLMPDLAGLRSDTRYAKLVAVTK